MAALRNGVSICACVALLASPAIGQDVVMKEPVSSPYADTELLKGIVDLCAGKIFESGSFNEELALANGWVRTTGTNPRAPDVPNARVYQKGPAAVFVNFPTTEPSPLPMPKGYFQCLIAARTKPDEQGEVASKLAAALNVSEKENFGDTWQFRGTLGPNAFIQFKSSKVKSWELVPGSGSYNVIIIFLGEDFSPEPTEER